MRKQVALVLALLLIPSCSSKPKTFNRQPLRDKILRPYPGKPGLLVEQACERDPAGKCLWSFEEFDLNDRATRIRLRDAGFVCNVGGVAYRIAQERPGLVIETHRQSCFLGICGSRTEVVVDYIPASDNQRLVDARTTCFSHFTFDYDSG